ncbi:MAG: Ni/Fe-hydrogenase subunit HybB-like protein [Glaciecola sp.]|jgi:Ni/Fe-hydrogenase subunit HybB-like protein
MKLVSSKKYYYSFIYLPLIIAVSFFTILIILFVDSNLIQTEMEEGKLKLLCGVFSFFSLLLYFLFSNHMAIIIVDNLGIEVTKEKEVIYYEWKEVKSINQILFVHPPLYKLRMEDGKWFLFCTGNKFIHFGLGVKDYSTIIKFIKSNVEGN